MYSGDVDEYVILNVVYLLFAVIGILVCKSVWCQTLIICCSGKKKAIYFCSFWEASKRHTKSRGFVVFIAFARTQLQRHVKNKEVRYGMVYKYGILKRLNENFTDPPFFFLQRGATKDQEISLQAKLIYYDDYIW